MKAKIWVIYNPKSGSLTEKERQKKINLLHSIPHIELIKTEFSGHATFLAVKAVEQNIPKIIVMGGDGTVNEVAQSLRNTAVVMGILPTGSGNGLARDLGVPMNFEKALQLNITQNKRLIDSCQINEKPFFCTSGIGFEAETAHRFSQQKNRGLLGYVQASLHTKMHYVSKSVQIGNQSFEKIFSLTFANASQFGNNAYIAPKAQLDDGIINVTLLQNITWLYSLPLSLSIFLKKIHTFSKYTGIEGTKFEFKLNEEIPILGHVDGEPVIWETNEFRVFIIPKSLWVVDYSVEKNDHKK